MVDVIARTEPLKNEPLDTLRGPQLSGVPRALRTSSEQLEKRATLADSPLWGTARPSLAPQGGRSSLPGLLEPLADGGTADAELACYVRLWDALAVQGKSLEPSLLERDSISSLGHGERLSRGATLVK